jgi:hypothetical protein
MSRNTFRGAIAFMVICLSAGIAFSQGLYWESTMTPPIAGAKEIHSTSYYRPHMFKQVSGEQASIFRLDKGLLIRVDKERKEYSEMTFAELEAQVKEASKAMEAQMTEMKKQLEKMPPEQRKMLGQFIGDTTKGGRGDTTIEVTKTSETKTISGYSCTKYVVKLGGKEFGSVWTTTGVPGFPAMRDDFRDFSQRMASLMPSRGSQIAVGMRKIDGFPIQTTMANITTTVTKVEKRSVAASEFEVPSGYTKVKADFFKDRPRRRQEEQH